MKTTLVLSALACAVALSATAVAEDAYTGCKKATGLGFSGNPAAEEACISEGNTPLYAKAPDPVRVLVDANGDEVGYYVGGLFGIRSFTGYPATVSLNGSTIAEHPGSLVYATANCTGPPYVRGLALGVLWTLSDAGGIDKPPLPSMKLPALYYSSKDIDYIEVTEWSGWGYDYSFEPEPPGWYCRVSSGLEALTPVYPNDPAITGIVEQYPAPLTIEDR